VVFHDEQEEQEKTEEQEEGIISTVVLDPEKIIRYYGFNAAHRNLNDREYRQYSAPPFEEFVAFLSAAVANRPPPIVEKRRHPIVEEGQPPIVEKRQHPKDHSTDRINGEKRMRNDDETIDISQSSDEICLDTTNSSHETEGSSEILSCPASPDVSLTTLERGCSITISHGTPLLSRCSSSVELSETKTNNNQKPSLSQFSAGIVPFSAQEEDTPHRGFFQKMMASLKRKEKVIES